MANEKKIVNDLDGITSAVASMTNSLKRATNVTAQYSKAVEGASNEAIDKVTESFKKLLDGSNLLTQAQKDVYKSAKLTVTDIEDTMKKFEQRAARLAKVNEQHASEIADLVKLEKKINDAKQKQLDTTEDELKLSKDREKVNKNITSSLKAVGLSLDHFDIKAGDAAGNLDKLSSEARATINSFQKFAKELSSPAAQVGKALQDLRGKVATNVEKFSKLAVVGELVWKAGKELYSQGIRLANKGLVGSMAQMNVSALKLRMTAEEFEGLVTANREMVAVMGGGAAGIANFAAVLKDSSVGLEHLGKEGAKVASTIMASFNRAGFGLMSTNEDVSKAYQSNIKSLNKQFKAFNGIFGDTAEEFANLYEQQLKSKALQARLLSGDTKSVALQMKELMVRTETLKLMGLSNQQIVDMSKRVDQLFNPQENRQGEAQTERIAARQAMALGAQTIQGTDPELASKIANFVSSGEMDKFQKLDSESKMAYKVQNAELFKGINKMQETIASMRDKNGGDTSFIGTAYVDRMKAAGNEGKAMLEYGKALNEAKAKGYDQSKEGREKLKTAGYENNLSGPDGETTLLGKSFGLLRTAVDSVTSILNNPFTGALSAIGASILFSSATIRSAVIGMADVLLKGVGGTMSTITNAGKTMFGSIGGFMKVTGGLLKGLLGFLKQIPVISAIVGGLEGAWDSFHTETEDYYDRLGADKKDSSLVKDIGIRLAGTLMDVGAATVRTGTFGLIDPSKNFADKQKSATSSPISSETAAKLPQSRSAQVSKSPIATSSSPIKGTNTGNEALVKQALADKGIVDPQQQAMLMGQLSHESGGFNRLIEGGNNDYFRKYEGKKNLGNTQEGDGLKFKGRGFIQLTGRANYAAAGQALGLDLLNNPELASDPQNAAKIAAWYITKQRKGGSPADNALAGNFEGLTKSINGGMNGAGDRLNRTNQYLAQINSPRSQLVTPQVDAGVLAANSTTSATTVSSLASQVNASTTSTMTPQVLTNADKNQELTELQKQTSLLSSVVSLLGRSPASPRGYQINQQTGISVGV